jgi:CheY-like chemotaxis protein
MAAILLLEDNDIFREVLTEALTRAGHAVRADTDGRRVNELLHEHPADLLITDLSMPNRDGVETILALRRSHPQLPIIAMSGDTSSHAALYLSIAAKLGVARTLQKPFAAATLLTAVDEVLGKGR